MEFLHNGYICSIWVKEVSHSSVSLSWLFLPLCWSHSVFYDPPGPPGQGGCGDLIWKWSRDLPRKGFDSILFNQDSFHVSLDTVPSLDR